MIHNLSGRKFTFSAEGFVNNIRKKYELDLELYYDISKKYELFQGSVGTIIVTFKKTKKFYWPRLFTNEKLHKLHDYKINYDQMSNELSEDDIIDMSEGNIVGINYRILKDQKLNGDINTALLQKVKKGEWTWIEFFKSYKDDDYIDDTKIEEEKTKKTK